MPSNEVSNETLGRETMRELGWKLQPNSAA
jgi:hypothetical protein